MLNLGKEVPAHDHGAVRLDFGDIERQIWSDHGLRTLHARLLSADYIVVDSDLILTTMSPLLFGQMWRTRDDRFYRSYTLRFSLAL